MTEDNTRLTRSDDRLIAGVCSGIAEYFELSVSKVRTATLLLILLGGVSAGVYFVLWIFLPQKHNR